MRTRKLSGTRNATSKKQKIRSPGLFQKKQIVLLVVQFTYQNMYRVPIIKGMFFIELLQVSNACTSRYWQLVGALFNLHQDNIVMTLIGH